MDEYIKREDAIKAITWNGLSEPEEIVRLILLTAQNNIRRISAADVVPKSDEGAECPTCHGTGRIGTTDWLTKNISKKQLAEEKAQAIAEHEQHIKTEVAREIFEEIDNLFDKYPTLRNIGGADIAELKKKYVKDCRTCKHLVSCEPNPFGSCDEYTEGEK